MARGKLRKGGASSRSQGARFDLDRVTRQSGKSVVSVSMVGNIRTVDITPHIDVRLETLGDLFENYRFTEIRLEIFPYVVTTTNTTYDAQSSSAGLVCTGYDEISEPDNFAEIAELPFSVYVPAGLTVGRSFTCRSKQLIGRNPLKWFNYGTQTDSLLEVQAILYLASSGATTPVVGEMEWTVEFTNPVPAEVTLSRRLHRTTPMECARLASLKLRPFDYPRLENDPSEVECSDEDPPRKSGETDKVLNAQDVEIIPRPALISLRQAGLAPSGTLLGTGSSPHRLIVDSCGRTYAATRNSRN